VQAEFPSLHWSLPISRKPAVTITSTAIAITQPRTDLNLVHSARSSSQKPSRPGRACDRYGVMVPAVIARHPRRPLRHGTPPRQP
jgi:hypothetical protein